MFLAKSYILLSFLFPKMTLVDGLEILVFINLWEVVVRIFGNQLLLIGILPNLDWVRVLVDFSADQLLKSLVNDLDMSKGVLLSERFTKPPKVSFILPENLRLSILSNSHYYLSFLLLVPSFSVIKASYI